MNGLVDEAVGRGVTFRRNTLRQAAIREVPQRSTALRRKDLPRAVLSTDSMARIYGAGVRAGAAGTAAFMSCPID